MGAGGKKYTIPKSLVCAYSLWSVHSCHMYNKPAVFLPQKNTCILPEDLRDFYLTTDGFTLTWSVKLDGR